MLKAGFRVLGLRLKESMVQGFGFGLGFRV